MKSLNCVLKCSIMILVILSVSCSEDEKSPTEPGPTNYTITGKILENGAGISGVSVNIKGTGVDETVTTNENGSYTFTNIPDGTYEITPVKSGFIFSPSKIITVISGSDETVQNITAAIIQSEGKIAFTSNRDGNNEIYVMDADGSNQTRLTDRQDNKKIFI